MRGDNGIPYPGTLPRPRSCVGRANAKGLLLIARQHHIPLRVVRRRERLGRLAQPVQQFIRTEASGGIVLLIAAVVALAWANSPWGDAYEALIHHHLSFDFGFWAADHTLEFWVNDAAMVLFFFVVGLEIKREAVVGELSNVRRVIVPVAGALGGMLAPALIFTAVLGGAEGARGWGIPIATDIAFALGVLTVVRPSVPLGLKVMLLALAIVDDIGGILVIALFYTEQIALLPLGIAVGALAAAFVMRQLGIWRIWPYVAVGLVGWAGMLESGVHPTIIGVAFGLLTPLRTWHDDESIEAIAEEELARYREARASTDPQVGHEERLLALTRFGTLARVGVAPLERLEHQLQPLVAFVVVPVFAFVNAGLALDADTLSSALASPLTQGIALGLVLGKPLGIVTAVWLAVRLGARLPQGVGWPSVIGVGALSGIGFTVSLLIANLSFSEPGLLAEAKLGVLGGSLVAGVIGYTLLRRGASRAGSQTVGSRTD
ncbi:MAG: Na+/H+ antiporter NhaA [Dehalococcoidia bacterium]